MQPWLIDLLKAILTGGVMTLALEIYRNFKKKNRESAEVSNIYKEGDQLNITIKTNIDKYVEEKTKGFQVQVTELEKTIVQISSKYRNDLEKYMQRIADLEAKFDEQLNRTQTVEAELSKEQKNRFDCNQEVKTLQARISLLENKPK